MKTNRSLLVALRSLITYAAVARFNAPARRFTEGGTRFARRLAAQQGVHQQSKRDNSSRKRKGTWKTNQFGVNK